MRPQVGALGTKLRLHIPTKRLLLEPKWGRLALELARPVLQQMDKGQGPKGWCWSSAPTHQAKAPCHESAPAHQAKAPTPAQSYLGELPNWLEGERESSLQFNCQY